MPLGYVSLDEEVQMNETAISGRPKSNNEDSARTGPVLRLGRKRTTPLPQAILELAVRNPAFDESQLSRPEDTYVAWMDVMGTATMMVTSTSTAVNFLAKLHIIACEEGCKAASGALCLHPIVDGLYVTSTSQDAILRFLTRVFRRLGVLFLTTKLPEHHFMVRACLAYGPLIDGPNLIIAPGFVDHTSPTYAEHILVGPPVSQAYVNEKKASPFGIWIEESARCFAPLGYEPLPYTHYRWWRKLGVAVDKTVARHLGSDVIDHLNWCRLNHSANQQKLEDIERHSELATEYFQEFLVSANGPKP